jgi:hypothetical protein
MRGVLAKGSRPTVICVSSGVFIGYYVLTSIKLTDIATLISGQ